MSQGTTAADHPAPPANWRPRVEAVLARLRGEPGPLLPILHAIQDELGWVPAEVVPVIAQDLNLSRAEVHGVISFYHEFRTTPRGRHLVHLCRAEACQSMGANALIAHAKKRLNVDFHGTTSDGTASLEPIYCLGNCALSPAMMIDGELHGRVSDAKFDALMTLHGIHA